MSNSLAAVHPELVAEWSEKNLPLTPDSITFGSNKKVCLMILILRITQRKFSLCSQARKFLWIYGVITV